MNKILPAQVAEFLQLVRFLFLFNICYDEYMKKYTKKIILFCTVLFALSSLFFMGFFIFVGVKDYVKILIISEQNDHYYKMQKNICELKSVLGDFDLLILKKQKLSKEDKKNILKTLRKLEEKSLNISRERGFYDEDTTVHLFFEPRGEIRDYFNKTRNTPLYIGRFVRAVEMGVFEQVLTDTQYDIIEQNYRLLLKEVDDL